MARYSAFLGRRVEVQYRAGEINRMLAPLRMVVPLAPLRKPRPKHLSLPNSAMSRLTLRPPPLAELLVFYRSPVVLRLPERFSDRHLSVSRSQFGYNRLLILSRIRARFASAAAEEAPLETCHWLDWSRAHGTAHGNESFESRLLVDCLESYRFAR